MESYTVDWRTAENMESSSEDNSEDGHDVYVPSIPISGRSISHEKPENSDSNDQKQFEDHLDIDQHVHKQGYKASDINDHNLEGRVKLTVQCNSDGDQGHYENRNSIHQVEGDRDHKISGDNNQDHEIYRDKIHGGHGSSTECVDHNEHLACLDGDKLKNKDDKNDSEHLITSRVCNLEKFCSLKDATKQKDMFTRVISKNKEIYQNVFPDESNVTRSQESVDEQAEKKNQISSENPILKEIEKNLEKPVLGVLDENELKCGKEENLVPSTRPLKKSVEMVAGKNHSSIENPFQHAIDLNLDSLGEPDTGVTVYDQNVLKHGAEANVIPPSPPFITPHGPNFRQCGHIPNMAFPSGIHNMPCFYLPYPTAQQQIPYQRPQLISPQIRCSQSLDDDHEAFVGNHQGDKSLGAKLKKVPLSKSNKEDIPVYQNIQQTESTRNKGGLPKKNEGDSHSDLNDKTKYDPKNEQSKYGEDCKLNEEVPQSTDREELRITIDPRQQGSKIVITFSGDISEHTLVYYFENTRKSGGGDIKTMDFSPDTGVSVIEFKESNCASNVWEKSHIHKVSGIDLNIHVIEQKADMSNVIEENMVFVRGMKQTTSKDCLMDYLEVRAGLEPTDMSYGSDETCALVVFKDKIDFLKLQDGCKKKLLEGSTLTVSMVPVTSSLLISGINPEIPKETIQYYFENTKRSGGDENLTIVEYDNHSCVIRFSSPTVARRVCDHKKQMISGCQLDVFMHYEFLGRRKMEVEIPDPEILPTDNNILKFVKNSAKRRQDFESKLKSLYAHVEWPKDFEIDETKIFCDIDLTTSEGQKAVNSWRSNITDYVEGYLSTMATMHVTTVAEVWSDVINELRSVHISDPENVCVILEKHNHAIVMAGDKNIVQMLCRDVRRILSNVEGRKLQTKQSATNVHVLSFKIYKLQLLWKLKFFDTVMQKYPGVEAKCNLDKREVTLSGAIEAIQAAELFLRETASSFIVKSFKMSKYKKDLLFKKGAREIWYNETRAKHITATWNVDRSHVCEMYARTRKDVERAIFCMEDLFLEDEYVVTDSFNNFVQSSRWQELLSKLEERDENCFIIKIENGKIQLAASKYIFREIKSDIEKEIEDFIRLHCCHSETLKCDKGVYLYLQFYGQKQIQQIESKLKEMEVKITGDKHNFNYEIKGNKTGISIALKKVSELMRTVHSDTYKLDAFGIRDYFLSQPGKKDTLDIAKRQSCVILQETEYSKDKARKELKDGGLKFSSPGIKRVFVHDENRKIYFVEGDITQLEVDVVVNAANNDMDHYGGLAKAIVDAAGGSVQDECHRYIKSHGPVKDGDAITSEPGQLPCKMIIHAVGPVWHGGQQGEAFALRDAVRQCLILTSKRGYQTVAIPALSGGIFGYPLEKCTDVIVRTIKHYFDSNTPSILNAVYLCDASSQTIRIFQTALHSVYHSDTSMPYDNENSYSKPIKYPSSEIDSDLEPLRYPDHKETVTATQDTGPTATGPNHYDSVDIDNSNYSEIWTSSSSSSRDGGFMNVVKGLLTDRKVDMIVNSISTDLDLSHGRLSRSILTAAGDQIQTEIYQQIDSFRPVENIALTSGGKLSCLLIAHGVLVPFNRLDDRCVKILRRFVYQCMMAASEKRFESIAFPAVGTGVLNFPPSVVAKVMFETVTLFKNQCPDCSLKKVEFVIYPKDTVAVEAFEDEFEKERRKSATFDTENRRTAQVQVDETERKLRPGNTVHVDKTEPKSRPRNTGRNKTTRLGDIDVLIKTGDITRENTDVVVNTTSKSLDLSKGAVSKAILTAAGSDLQKQLIQAAEGNRGLIVTSGGKMDCKYIFHIMAQSNLIGWETMVTKCLQEADKKRLSTISIPALGTGIKACNPSDVASAIFSAVKKFKPVQHVKQVTVVVFQNDMAVEFIAELQKDVHTHRYKDTRSEEHSESKPFRPQQREYSKDEMKTNSIKFFIWSDSWFKIKSVKRDLEMIAETQCHKKIINDFVKVVSSLKNDKIFRDIEKQNNVKITVVKGIIHISGQQINVTKASDALSSYLRKEENQMLTFDRAKDVSTYVQWHYKDLTSDRFRPFKIEDNYTIETEYKQKSLTVRIQDGKGVTYKIDFQKMEECAINNPRIRIPVQRRLKEHDKGAGSGVNLPPDWAPMKQGQLCHEQQLFPGHKEYDRVKSEFQKSGGAGTIVKIFRVQNPMFYLQYAAKRKELQNKNGRNPERWLWHGTAADTVDKIIHHGFNRSYCGKNGITFGAGVYFSPNAQLSEGFCTKDVNGNAHIFSVQVLTGFICQGHSGLTVLPPRPGKDHMTYDSAADNPSNPSEVVIFHDSQAYPTYHVLFT